MAANGTVLKALLRDRHLQEHGAFSREYDRVARALDPHLVGGYPSKATFYRWLAGEVRTLPYPGHCRVLERMLAGWSAAELFRPWAGDEPPRPPARREAGAEAGPKMADLAAVHLTRAELFRELPPEELFRDAAEVRAAGLSLNVLCQSYGGRRLRNLVEAGCQVRCLFLDPDGTAIGEREREENYPPGYLVEMTRFNLQVTHRVRAQLGEPARSGLQVRSYDEPVRFNITIVDGRLCVVQPYLPEAPGTDSPTLLVARQPGRAGLFATFSSVFDSLWERGKPVPDSD